MEAFLPEDSLEKAQWERWRLPWVLENQEDCERMRQEKGSRSERSKVKIMPEEGPGSWVVAWEGGGGGVERVCVFRDGRC